MVMLSHITVIDEITDILHDLKNYGNLNSVDDEFVSFVHKTIIDISRGMSTIADEKAFIYDQVLLLVTEENARIRAFGWIRKKVCDEQRAEDRAQKRARAEEDRTRALAELSPEDRMAVQRKHVEDEICVKPSWYGISSRLNGKEAADALAEPVAGGSRVNGKEPAAQEDEIDDKSEDTCDGAGQRKKRK
jgi:hypothetical protein